MTTPIPISALPGAAPLTGDELMVVVQDGVTSQTTVGAQPFTFDAVGAVPRSMVSKMSDIVSVKDFGATGDGATDDTAAIQAAIEYVESVFGGTVYFPAGVYIITTPIVIAGDGVTLQGAGSGGSGSGIGSLRSAGTLIGYQPDNDGIIVQAISGCTIRDLTMRPTGVAFVGAAVTYLAAGGVTPQGFHRIDSVVIEGAWIGVLASPNCYSFSLTNCLFYECIAGGAQIGNTTGGALGSYLVEGCEFSASVEEPTHLRFDSYSGARVVGNRFVGGDTAMFFAVDAPTTDTLAATVSGNSLFNYIRYGISFVTGAAITAADISITGNVLRSDNVAVSGVASINLIMGANEGRVAVSGNAIECFNSTEIAIDVVSGDSFAVTGNVLASSTSATTGVRIGTAVNYATVTGNTFKGWLTNVNNTSAGNQIMVANNISDKALESVGSASPLAIPDEGDVFLITGAVNFAAITKVTQVGRRVTLIFAGALTITASASLLLVGGTMVTTANDTLTLVCNGTIWYETSRAVL